MHRTCFPPLLLSMLHKAIAMDVINLVSEDVPIFIGCAAMTSCMDGRTASRKEQH